MEPEEASTRGPPTGARLAPVAIIGAEDEDFENDIEPNPEDQNSPFQSLERLRQHPAYLMAFLHHVVLQFDSCPVLCSLHVEMLRGMSPKEGRKQLLEFCHLFLDKTALLRVPIPHHVQFELERMRLELLPEELQRRLLQEVQSFQQPEVSRQLEDFRSKRLMGMTPGEPELGELESYRTRDVGIREAKERQLAEGLLARLEEMHPTISADEEKSSAIFGAIVTYMRFLGVRTKPGEKKPKSNFFRKKISGPRREEPPRPRRGFTLPGASLWGRDPHNTEFRQSKAEGEAEKAPPSEKKGPRPEAGGPTRPRVGAASAGTPDPPSVAVTISPLPGEDAESDPGLDPPGSSEPTEPPPRSLCPQDLPHSEQHPAEEGAENERRRIRLPGRSASLRVPEWRRPPRDPDKAKVKVKARSRSDLALCPRSPEPGGPGGGGGGSGGGAGGGAEPPPSSLPPQAEEPESRPEPEPEPEPELEPPAWRELVPPQALRALSKSEIKRQEVINELFLTEHAHVRMLRVLLELFLQPMLREGFFAERELAAIFPGLEDLVEVHALFLDSLRRRREESGYVIARIGDVLLARFEGAEGSWFQKLSGRFCSRQSFALEQLKAKQRKDARFNQFIQEAESQARCRRLQLKDIIPTEMQRLTKYPLLLHSITQCTEEADERAKVEQAAECCRQILNHVNQEVRDMENLMKLKDYQRRLDLSNLKQSTDPLLCEFKNTDITQRTLVHEGPLSWRVARDKAVEVQVLLLDDLLVLLQRQEERLVLRGHSRPLAPGPDSRRLLSPVVRLRSAMTRQVATDPKAFYVIVSWESGAQIYELGAPSVAERKTWCTLINETAGALKLPGGAQRAKPPRGGQSPPSPVCGYREPLSENGGSLKEPLPLDERDKDGAVEGTEFEGGPGRSGGAALEPPRGGGGQDGAMAAEALRRVSALKQLLLPAAGVGPGAGAGDGAPSPTEDAWGGPDPPPPEEEQRDAGDGAESESPDGGAAGIPPNGPRSPGWGSRLPLPVLPPPQAAWLEEELRGLEETLRGLKEIEERYWQLQQLLAQRGPAGGT